jgi:plasmid stability protein
MATIQIRDIPEDSYDTIRRRAKAEGKSLQSYMRDQVVARAPGLPCQVELVA